MNLKIAAAKVTLESFDSDEVIKISSDALEHTYSDSLGELVMSSNLRSEDVAALLRKSFNELGLEWPSREESIRQLVTFYLQQITQGQVDPRNGVISLMNAVLVPAKSLESCDQYVGDKLGLERILGAFSAYDDVDDSPETVSYSGKYGVYAIQEIDRDIVAESRRWLEQYASN